MKILLVLNELTVPGRGERKEGLYPTLIRMHTESYSDVSILAANTRALGEKEISDVSNMLGNAVIIKPKTWRISNLLAYITKLPLNSTFLIFSRFVYSYRYELSALSDHFKKNNLPDVLTALQSCENSGILAYIVSRKYRVPYVVMEHRTHYQRGVMKDRRGRVARVVIQSAKTVLTVSPQLGDSIRRAMAVDGLNITTMPNPIPNDFFEKPTKEFEAVKVFANERFVFGAWTNWRDIKRLDLALEAFRLVSARSSAVCLVVAGPVPDWAEDKINQLGLSASVLLLGSINRVQIKSLSYQSDCCILTSDHETFGLPVIESLAAGRPVVATKCGGPESIIVDAAFGRLVECGDVSAFADAMIDVRDNYDMFDADELRRYCSNTFGEKALSDRWSNLYKKLILPHD